MRHIIKPDRYTVFTMTGVAANFDIADGISLRFRRVIDEPFLLDLFIEARPWLAAVQGERDFIRTLQEQQYQTSDTGQGHVYPEHMDFVIERVGYPVGRIVIDISYTNWRITDIQILTQARRSGIATNVLRAMQHGASRARLPLTLSAPMFGPSAFQFYHRLGFQVSAVQPPMVQMAWFPPGMSQPNCDPVTNQIKEH